MPKPKFGAFNQGDIPKIAVFNKATIPLGVDLDQLIAAMQVTSTSSLCRCGPRPRTS